MTDEEFTRALVDTPDEKIREQMLVFYGDIDRMEAQIYALRQGINLRKQVVSVMERVLAMREVTRRASQEPAA